MSRFYKDEDEDVTLNVNKHKFIHITRKFILFEIALNFPEKN